MDKESPRGRRGVDSGWLVAGRPKAIVSLMDEELAGLLSTARRAVGEGADMLEWRADFFAHVEDSAACTEACRALVDALPMTPLIFTFRSKGQGGSREMADDAYESLLRTVVDGARPDLVDIELGRGDALVARLVDCAHACGTKALVSHHDFARTPTTDEMLAVLGQMAKLGADIPKLAVMAHDMGDAQRLMTATREARGLLGDPLLTLAMGEAGSMTRLEGERFGSMLTFCALGRASAPGQVELGEALQIMDRIHAELEAESMEGRA